MTATTNLNLVATLLADDPVWSAYAIADLQPAMTPYCRWFTHTDGDAHAVALIFDGLEPPVLFTKGDPMALAAALAGVALPTQVYLSVREEHAPVLAQWYDHRDQRHMWRMVWRERKWKTGNVLQQTASNRQSLASQSLNLPILPNGFQLRRLTGADVAAVKALFAHGGLFTPDAFAAHQVELGVFYGVEDEHGALAAVGGTHVVDYAAQLAAIGNMYTRPGCRGRGFASAVLGAIVASLQADGVTTIVLNVDHRNPDARRIYERFGFVVHCPYIEGVAATKI
jgi:ribosomal protein S18 acetylase RimI-like enzyme